ncbi:MAG: PQQ-like beta-propeller repeat protein [Planctomycetaceae bacterium]|nr:PQQ-like beta-propeller repeat protein [Planctomycetaceae bacterium]
MRSTVLTSCLSLALTAIASTSSLAENWPQWRGPTGNGLSGETGIATEWSNEKNVAWRLPLPGPAGATPIVWGDRIFVTSTVGSDEGADLVLVCASTDGKQLWQKKVGSGNLNARTTEGNSASPTPVTDGEHVWTFFGTGILGCYDFEGNEVWKFNVQDRYGEFDIQFGMSSTPVLDGDHLYLQLLHGKWGGEYLVQKVIKLKKSTGEDVWAVDRAPEPGAISLEMGETKQSYASPIMYNDGKHHWLVTHGADSTIGHDLSDGHEVWRIGGLNGPSSFNPGQFDQTFRFVTSPTAVDGTIIIATAKRGPSVAVKVDDSLKGRIEKPSDQIRWVNDKTPDVCCPLVVDGLVYFVRKSGQVFCVDLKTGDEFYYENTRREQHRSSPVYCDGHIYSTARDGHTTVFKTGPKLEIVAENDLGETMTSTPVISNGTLYMRTYDALYAIRK